jgi:hypothetical protein
MGGSGTPTGAASRSPQGTYALLINQCNSLRLVLIEPSPCNIPLSF